MPVIANSSVTASEQPGSTFSPTGDFNVVVTAGRVQLNVRHSGAADWVWVADMVDGSSTQAKFMAGTSTRVLNHIAGSEYRLVPVAGAATASAWSA